MILEHELNKYVLAYQADQYVKIKFLQLFSKLPHLTAMLAQILTKNFAHTSHFNRSFFDQFSKLQDLNHLKKEKKSLPYNADEHVYIKCWKIRT